MSTLFLLSLCGLAATAPKTKNPSPTSVAPFEKITPFKEGLFSKETRSSGFVREANFFYFKVNDLPEAEPINFMTEECAKDFPLFETTRSNDFARESKIPPF